MNKKKLKPELVRPPSSRLPERKDDHAPVDKMVRRNDKMVKDPPHLNDKED